MQDESPLGRAIAMVADLRRRCDWDRIQTRETLRPYLLEEVHELDAALGTGDADAIRDEVADLMLHLAWQLVLGLETREFTPTEVADRLVEKMQRRHPHLFDLGPRERWETLKARERRAPGGRLGSVPSTLPQLLRAYRLQERAAAVGFDWPDTEGPAAKVREELHEVETAIADRSTGAHEALAEEIGDLLFAVVNLARKAGVQPGPALDRSNRKFTARFEQVERLAEQRGLSLEGMTLAEMDTLWDEVKREERTPSP